MATPEKPAATDSDRGSALNWAAAHGHNQALLAELAARAARRRRRLRLATAAGAVALLAVGLGLSPFVGAARRADPGRVAVSVPSRQVLPDGTEVQLRGDAMLTVDFSGALRRVNLSRGEAYFQVAKDPARPFVVGALGIEVRAVGTAFSVQLGAAQVEVLVTEGRVAVAEAPANVAAADLPRAGPAYVDAGQLAVVAAGAPQVINLPAAQSADRLAWRIPRIEFTATPLAEAIARLNRLSAVQLSLGDDSLANLRISGVVRTDNGEALVRLLVANYEVDARFVTERTVVLHRR
jgi:transmembrane sensor